MDPIRNSLALRPWLMAGLFAATASLTAPTSSAATTEVQFDVSHRLECRDVTPADFATRNPDEKLVEARFQVSTLIRAGREEDLLQCLYHVRSSRQTMQIVDYNPKTILAPELAGNIAVEEKGEKNAQLAVGLAVPSLWNAKATANGDLGAKRQQLQRYELLPPLLPLAASGTLDRGYGVYFKLKPSQRTSLEGSREFTIVFRVAKSWRADYVQLACQALGVSHSVLPPLNEPLACGVRRFTVALHAAGDAEAKAAAERLSRAESGLLRSVSSNRRELAKRFYPTLAHKLGVVEPLIPENWAEQLIYDARPDPVASFGPRLPHDVREAVSEYTLAKRELSRLGLAPEWRVQ